ncbi:MAG: 8-oxo-dGTP diphosphatase [Lachnospiraceae bacterium]|nr:8-oxo-dGTP diphosphatase [Lachnospiraceae bacterium]
MEMTTLCYLEKDNAYLMLHRISKKNDLNKGKWIGVGGHFEGEESPEECLIREVFEETGLTLTRWKPRGLVTFISGRGASEYMFLFTADGFTGELTECNEGVLEWVPKDKVTELELWPGDRVFLKLLGEREDFFLLKLIYDENDALTGAVLDGQIIDPVVS